MTLSAIFGFNFMCFKGENTSNNNVISIYKMSAFVPRALYTNTKSPDFNAKVRFLNQRQKFYSTSVWSSEYLELFLQEKISGCNDLVDFYINVKYSLSRLNYSGVFDFQHCFFNFFSAVKVWWHLSCVQDCFKFKSKSSSAFSARWLWLKYEKKIHKNCFDLYCLSRALALSSFCVKYGASILQTRKSKKRWKQYQIMGPCKKDSTKSLKYQILTFWIMN